VTQCLAQRRSLVLYKTATSTTVLGMHKLLPFDVYKIAPPSASKRLINVAEGKRSIAKNISLQELYDNYIKPGQLLYLNDNLRKPLAEDIDQLRTAVAALQSEGPESYKTFGIYEAGSKPAWKKTTMKNPGALKVTPVSLSSPMEYFKMAMDRSYQFIEQGCPVEFGIRIKGAGMKKEERLKPAGLDDWIWMHEHFPHLRPDFILKSMPIGSNYIVAPVTDGRIVQFVIGAGKKFQRPLGLTTRLLKVKAAVQTSVEQGRQAQLPKRYRAVLQNAGNKAYSEFSGMPLPKKAEYEAVEVPTETERDPFLRYLPEPVVGNRPPRDDKLSSSGDPIKSRPQKEYVRIKKNKNRANRASESRGHVGRPQHRRAFEQMGWSPRD
jgi:hypothetical protein